MKLQNIHIGKRLGLGFGATGGAGTDGRAAGNCQGKDAHYCG